MKNKTRKKMEKIFILHKDDKKKISLSKLINEKFNK
jgi:hypothetical protein